MRIDLRRIVAVGLLAIGLSACSTSTGTINTPIGKIQLGMYLDEVEDILGPGTVVVPGREQGTFIVETLSYPSGDGRTYVVYYVNEVVRRWELKDQASTASQSQ
jgi:hypothetical protein